MFSSKHAIEAQVVENALVVSFTSPKEPRVWRIDMGQFLSGALEIQEKQGKFYLLMKPGSGPAEEIGSFPDRKKAVEALHAVTAALLAGPHHAHAHHHKRGGWLWAFLKFIFFSLVALLIVLLLLPRAPVSPQGDAAQAVQPPAQTGVPVPAEELFGQ